MDSVPLAAGKEDTTIGRLPEVIRFSTLMVFPNQGFEHHNSWNLTETSVHSSGNIPRPASAMIVRNDAAGNKYDDEGICDESEALRRRESAEFRSMVKGDERESW